jgi:hypothetical protein
MNAQHIFCSTFLVLAIISNAAAMDKGSWDCNGEVKNFNVTVNDTEEKQRTFRFVSYTFDTMTEEDQIAFLDNYDYEGVFLVLGDAEKAKEHCQSAKNPEEYFRVARERQRIAEEKRKESGVAVNSKGISWLVWEIGSDGNKHFFAQMGMAPYIDAKPEKYAQTDLVSFSLNVHRNYRHSNLGSEVMHKVMNFFKQFECFKNVIFCLRAQPINHLARQMAERLHFSLATKDVSWETLLKSGMFQTKLDLYIEQCE